MSTRCQIGIYEHKDTPLEDFKVLLYRHCDGYPEGNFGVVVILEKFLTFFKKERGLGDYEFLGARLLQYICNETECDDDSSKLTGVTGYGISQEFHGDIEFFYKIYPNEIQVLKVNNDNRHLWPVLDTIKIK